MDATAALRLYLDDSERTVLDAVRANSRTSTTGTTRTTSAAKGKR
jgi:hypothetical protein